MITNKKMIKKYKGIVLAGGTGSRLFPITQGTSKHLLPIYNKPMLYYPISVLMLAGIQDILIICSSEYEMHYKKLMGDGSQYGVNISYAIQDNPNGIGEAFLIGEKFIGNDNVSLILGDNLFYGHRFSEILHYVVNNNTGATLFSIEVDDPSSFGVIKYKENTPIKIIEKPQEFISQDAVTGLYFYDNSVIEKAKLLTPSKRNELEITEINNMFFNEKNIEIQKLGRGFAWLDTGTTNNLFEAGIFVRSIENQQNHMIACLEEIAYENGWISKEDVVKQSFKYKDSRYAEYLLKIVND
jgi:glucose-1-phosphate thymidylyltransferase